MRRGRGNEPFLFDWLQPASANRFGCAIDADHIYAMSLEERVVAVSLTDSRSTPLLWVAPVNRIFAVAILLVSVTFSGPSTGSKDQV